MDILGLKLKRIRNLIPAQNKVYTPKESNRDQQYVKISCFEVARMKKVEAILISHRNIKMN